jgi:DNA-binding YbaB/EbfC family protein
MKNLAGLMKQASQMQAKMEEMKAKLEAMELQGSAGAGMVTLTLNGRGELKALTIDPKLADPTDLETLQDLLIAAHADAKQKIDAATEAQMREATGGLQLPGGMKLPF